MTVECQGLGVNEKESKFVVSAGHPHVNYCKHSIQIETMSDKKSFESIGLSPWICKQMNKLGLKSPTAIQQECIPAALSGRDCIGAGKK